VHRQFLQKQRRTMVQKMLTYKPQLRKDLTMHILKTCLAVLALAMGGILVGCQQTPPAPTTVVVPGDTPTPQTKTESTTTHTETKQSTPATVNPDGQQTPQLKRRRSQQRSNERSSNTAIQWFHRQGTNKTVPWYGRRGTHAPGPQCPGQVL